GPGQGHPRSAAVRLRHQPAERAQRDRIARAPSVHADAAVCGDDLSRGRSGGTLATAGRRRRAVHQVLRRGMTDIDWDDLRQVVTEAIGKAYAACPHYRVCAAALVDDGRVVSGCNFENASYGVTLCAECALVGD